MYNSEIQQLATKCKFGDSLDEMLRNRIVCRSNDSRIQQRLFAKSADLSFKKETCLRPIEHAVSDYKLVCLLACTAEQNFTIYIFLYQLGRAYTHVMWAHSFIAHMHCSTTTHHVINYITKPPICHGVWHM